MSKRRTLGRVAEDADIVYLEKIGIHNRWAISNERGEFIAAAVAREVRRRDIAPKKGLHRFVVDVESATRKGAELALLVAFSLRKPDGGKFHLRRDAKKRRAK